MTEPFEVQATAKNKTNKIMQPPNANSRGSGMPGMVRPSSVIFLSSHFIILAIGNQINDS